jgi:hypothetical protein
MPRRPRWAGHPSDAAACTAAHSLHSTGAVTSCRSPLRSRRTPPQRHATLPRQVAAAPPRHRARPRTTPPWRHPSRRGMHDVAPCPPHRKPCRHQFHDDLTSDRHPKLPPQHPTPLAAIGPPAADPAREGRIRSQGCRICTPTPHRHGHNTPRLRSGDGTAGRISPPPLSWRPTHPR